MTIQQPFQVLEESRMAIVSDPRQAAIFLLFAAKSKVSPKVDRQGIQVFRIADFRTNNSASGISVQHTRFSSRAD